MHLNLCNQHTGNSSHASEQHTTGTQTLRHDKHLLGKEGAPDHCRAFFSPAFNQLYLTSFIFSRESRRWRLEEKLNVRKLVRVQADSGKIVQWQGLRSLLLPEKREKQPVPQTVSQNIREGATGTDIAAEWKSPENAAPETAASGTQSPRHTTRELLGGRCLQTGGKAQERNRCGFLSPSRGSIFSLNHESKRGRGRSERKMVLFLKMNKIFQNLHSNRQSQHLLGNCYDMIRNIHITFSKSLRCLHIYFKLSMEVSYLYIVCAFVLLF